jgi:demethylmenaquinone methyltransferase/2-methoxy-6-polyprenyl-1,4-benzoquinol methylase
LSDALLGEQAAYYRARAAEYDDWWYRRREFDFGAEFAEAWWRDVDELRAAFDAFAPNGDVLELAAGTGIWTGELLRFADRVTAVDASAETLAVNEAKHGTDRVDRVCADLFSFTPPRRFDVVFFSFWISHVPPERWPAFWSLVADALAPGGRVFFLDSVRPEHAIANGPQGWRNRASADASAEAVDGRAVGGVTQRTLRNGSRFRVVKRYWTPAVLEAELESFGWQASVSETAWAFVYGAASRREV